MPTKDIYHDLVKNALISQGWTITHDPLVIPAGVRKVFIDLGAEMIGAERNNEKIAIEIKSFVGQSELNEFHSALGQYRVYKIALTDKEPERMLYLGISEDIYEDFFQDTFIQKVINQNEVNLLIYNIESKQIVKWIK
jgi:hypothetical protein